MSRLIYTAFVSLDGVVEAPGGEPGYRNTGWTFAVDFDEDVYSIKAREQDEAGAMMLGRVSYQAFSAVAADGRRVPPLQRHAQVRGVHDVGRG